MASGHLDFQFKGTTVLSPDRSVPPIVTKASRPAEHKTTGTGSKGFASESLGVIVGCTAPISAL